MTKQKTYRKGTCECCGGEEIPTKVYPGGDDTHEYCEFCEGLPMSRGLRRDPAVVAAARLFRLLKRRQ